jgi:hypothetical protein
LLRTDLEDADVALRPVTTALSTYIRVVKPFKDALYLTELRDPSDACVRRIQEVSDELEKLSGMSADKEWLGGKPFKDFEAGAELIAATRTVLIGAQGA